MAGCARQAGGLLNGGHFSLQGVSTKNSVVFILQPPREGATLHARQGPWIEGWQTPPGPEGSNGSLPFLVVVPWRTFRLREVHDEKSTIGALRASRGTMNMP